MTVQEDLARCRRALADAVLERGALQVRIAELEGREISENMETAGLNALNAGPEKIDHRYSRELVRRVFKAMNRAALREGDD